MTSNAFLSKKFLDINKKNTILIFLIIINIVLKNMNISLAFILYISKLLIAQNFVALFTLISINYAVAAKHVKALNVENVQNKLHNLI